MTKAELIDLVYLEASKWKLSKDVNIQRVDIAAFLPLFITDAIKIFQQEARRDQLEELRIFGASSAETINAQFVTTLKVTPSEDTDTDFYIVDLPKKVAILPFGRGINDLRPKNGSGYQRVQSFREIDGVQDFITAYWFDNVDSTQRLYINNIGQPVCEHYLSIVVDFTDLEDTDEVYLPAGMNTYILKEARNYIIGDKTIPAEYQIDYKEDR